MSENMNNDIIEEKPLSWWQRIKYVFISPDKAFRNIAEYPRALFPVAVTILVMTVVALLTIDKNAYIQNLIREYETMKLGQPSMQTMTASYYSTIFMMPIGPLLFWAFKTFFVSGLGNKMGDRENTFKATFSVIGHAYFPVVLGQAIFSILGAVIGVGAISTNLAVLFSKSMEGSFLYFFSSYIDIFVIWYQILAIIGVSYLFKLSKKKAALIVLGTWLTWILLSSGIATVVTALSPGPI